MTSAYNYTGDKDVTGTGKQCIPWTEIVNNGGSYIFGGRDGFTMHVTDPEIISGMSESQLESMENKCR